MAHGSDHHDDHHSDHEHSHHLHGHHGHSHAPKDFTRAFFIGITLNAAFVVIEAGYGFFTNSLALLADAGHNLGDVLGLGIAWGAAHLAKKKASDRYSYGLKSTSILAALINAAILLVAVGAIFLEAIERFRHPQVMEGGTVMLVAAIGIAVNGFTAFLFSRGRESDLNVRGAYLHMLADALVSVGVVISAFLFMKTGWVWIDPAVGIVISITIFMGTLNLLKESTNLALHAVPSHIDLKKVRTFLTEQAGVTEVHDLHVRAMSTTEVALTCHLTTKNTELFYTTGRLQKIADDIEHQFGIGHSTIQVDHEHDVSHCVSDTPHEH